MQFMTPSSDTRVGNLGPAIIRLSYGGFDITKLQVLYLDKIYLATPLSKLKWTFVAETNATEIECGPQGAVYVVDTSGQIIQRVGTLLYDRYMLSSYLTFTFCNICAKHNHSPNTFSVEILFDIY